MTDPARDLVESARRGDPLAVDALLERYLPGLEAFVRLRSGKRLLARESSADIVQSVCREVLNDAGDFHYESESHFKHWLYTTALRKIANRYAYYRAEKRDIGKEVPLERAASSGAAARETRLLEAYRTLCTPSQELIAREAMERVEAAFEKLTDEHREVILLARVVGLSHAEISEKMHRNEGAARALLFRALTKLSGLLETP